MNKEIQKLKEENEIWKNIVEKLHKKISDNFKELVMPEFEKLSPKQNDFIVFKYEMPKDFDENEMIQDYADEIFKLFEDKKNKFNLTPLFIPKNFTTELLNKNEMKKLLKNLEGLVK